MQLDSYGRLLTPIIVKKIPSDLRHTLSRKLTGTDWTIDNIVEALQAELGARE